MGTDPVCHYCEKVVDPTDLRPYGPGGALVCFPCATSTPEREATTKAGFDALLEATEIIGGGVVTLTESGLSPGIDLPPAPSGDLEGQT